MNHRIIGDSFPVLICELDQGETMVTQRGGMSWRTAHIEMNTDTGGGLLKGIKRSLAGGNIFINRYTALRNGQEIAFGLSFPGEIKTFNLSAGQEIIAQKNAFIACTENIDIDIYFNRRVGAGLFANEGFILERFSGEGLLFIEIDGTSKEYQLAAGEKLVIDCGYLAAMEPTVTFDIEIVKGLKNIAFGGEGLFLGNLTGPGKVWLQTLPVTGLERMFGAAGK